MPSDDLARLLRWVESGGTWRLVRRRRGEVDLDLMTCTGDEAMESFSSDAEDVLAYVSAGVPGSEDADAPRSGDQASG